MIWWACYCVPRWSWDNWSEYLAQWFNWLKTKGENLVTLSNCFERIFHLCFYTAQNGGNFNYKNEGRFLSSLKYVFVSKDSHHRKYEDPGNSACWNHWDFFCPHSGCLQCCKPLGWPGMHRKILPSWKCTVRAGGTCPESQYPQPVHMPTSFSVAVWLL